MKDPWGKEIYWIGGGRITWSGDAASDFRPTSDAYISVTPLHMDMTNYDLIEVVRKWLPGDCPRRRIRTRDTARGWSRRCSPGGSADPPSSSHSPSHAAICLWPRP